MCVCACVCVQRETLMKATWLISPNSFHVYQANCSCFSWDYLQKCIVDRYTPVWFLYAKCMHVPVWVCPPRAAVGTAKSNSLEVIWESRTWVPVLTLVKRGNNNFYCPICEHEMKELMWKRLMNYEKDSTHESQVGEGKGRSMWGNFRATLQSRWRCGGSFPTWIQPMLA